MGNELWFVPAVFIAAIIFSLARQAIEKKDYGRQAINLRHAVVQAAVCSLATALLLLVIHHLDQIRT
jgi:hypothetical protein